MNAVRRSLILLTPLLPLFLAGCSEKKAEPAYDPIDSCSDAQIQRIEGYPPRPLTVYVADNCFYPLEMTIREGETVTFILDGGVDHPIGVRPLDSQPGPEAQIGGVWPGKPEARHSFEEPGEYYVYCFAHGSAGFEMAMRSFTVLPADG